MRPFLPAAALLAGALLVISACGDLLTPEFTPPEVGPRLGMVPASFAATVDFGDGEVEHPECLTPGPVEGSVVATGCVLLGTISGDLVGSVKVIADARVDELGTGPARAVVKVCVAPPIPTVCEDGDFEGRFQGELQTQRSLFSGTFHLRGKASGVRGTSIEGTVAERIDAQGNDFWDLTGTIHSRTR